MRGGDKEVGRGTAEEEEEGVEAVGALGDVTAGGRRVED
jgi:hypothetical protein